MSPCPLCGGGNAEIFLRRAQVPVHQNLVMADAAAARAAARGALSMAVCADCGFVFNAGFEPAKIAYGRGYDNNQACSARFQAHMDALAGEVLAHSPRNAVIVEVGCGNGRFLRKLTANGNRAIGFDPSYDGPDSDLDGRLTFRRSYYDSHAASVTADVVVCRHVIEHVPAPMDFLRTVRSAARDARVFFETPCVEWILANAVIWDFFYEHCSLFSADTLRYACAKAGFAADSVTHTFGGQYLWLRGKSAAPTDRPPREAAVRLRGLAHSYAKLCDDQQAAWMHRLADLGKRGPVALWGAGAKGATFANLLDPDRAMLACVVDINPNKQGRYLPGSAHEIVAPEELARRGVKSAVLPNPNYRDEIAALLAALDVQVDLVDLL